MKDCDLELEKNVIRVLWAEVCKAAIDVTISGNENVYCIPLQRIVYTSCIFVDNTKVKVYAGSIFPSTVIERENLSGAVTLFNHMDHPGGKHKSLKKVAQRYVNSIFDPNFIDYDDDNFF